MEFMRSSLLNRSFRKRRCFLNMENYNVEDAVGKDYDSHLMKRLIGFTKPFAKYFVIVIFLMLITTALDLSRPALIKNAIDKFINGYNSNYTVTTTDIGGSVKISGVYVKRGSSTKGILSTIILKDDTYYLKIGSNHTTLKGTITSTSTSSSKSIIANKLVKLTSADLKSLRKDDANGILATTIYLFIISLCIFVIGYVQVYLLSYTGQKIVFDIRQKLFSHVEGLSLSFFDKNPVGRLVTRLTNDVDALNEMYTGVLVYLFKDFFLIFGVLIAMFIMNFKLGLITLAVVPFLIIAALIFKKHDRNAYRDVRVKIARINSSLSENISGMKTVQIYAKEDKKLKEFSNINKSYLDSSLKQIKVYAIFRPAIDFLAALTMAALLWFGGVKVLNMEIGFGMLFAFISYLQYFFQPIYDLTEKYDILQSAMASSERIFMLMDNNERIVDSEKPVKVETLVGEIEFKNVWFAYVPGEWVLKDVSFKIKPGEKVAFVGATGAGKTSIISLISRFYDIQKGEILIDGINIKDMDIDNLRGNIATVLQDVFLFTGDIKQNIRLKNDDITDEEIINACKYVNADKFIEKLPEGYSAPVNERGSTFSQGERQLIAFARAIAFNPPILVLDEATSNIDTETEALIQDALGKISKDRTTIVVAHRLSTIKNSNKIIVLHKGKLREMGTHEELLNLKGLYYNLYQLQYKDLEKC
jgi:ATP-binding cassette, subfamily B, multidrug efflux pump